MPLAVSLALAASVIGCGLTAAEGAGAVTITTVQGESVRLKSGRTYSVPDRSASAGRALYLKRNASATAILGGHTERVTVRVRGKQCLGAPKLRIRYDGKVLGTRTVRRKRWVQLRFPLASTQAGGQHTVSVAFINQRSSKHCTRGLVLDWFSTANNPAALLPAPPTSSDVPTPSAAASNPDPQPTFTGPPTPTASGISKLYVDPGSSAAQTAAAWRSSRPADAAAMDKIGGNPGSFWVGGYDGELGHLDDALSEAAGQKARVVLTIYGIPFRDGGQYSSGGLPNGQAYRSWIDSIAAHVGGHAVLVIVEPDSVAMQIPNSLQSERFQLLSYAVSKLHSLPDAKIYLDAGNPAWRPPSFMVPRLQAAGVAQADGIAVNTANFQTNATSIAYGRAISAGIGGKPFVIDSGRNGNGPVVGATGEATWCNPAGRALGSRPTMVTGIANVDAFLWVQHPGQSNGACFGNPKAGTWMPEAALAMAKAAKW